MTNVENNDVLTIMVQINEIKSQLPGIYTGSVSVTEAYQLAELNLIVTKLNGIDSVLNRLAYPDRD